MTKVADDDETVLRELRYSPHETERRLRSWLTELDAGADGERAVCRALQYVMRATVHARRQAADKKRLAGLRKLRTATRSLTASFRKAAAQMRALHGCFDDEDDNELLRRVAAVVYRLEGSLALRTAALLRDVEGRLGPREKSPSVLAHIEAILRYEGGLGPAEIRERMIDSGRIDETGKVRSAGKFKRRHKERITTRTKPLRAAVEAERERTAHMRRWLAKNPGKKARDYLASGARRSFLKRRERIGRASDPGDPR